MQFYIERERGRKQRERERGREREREREFQILRGRRQSERGGGRAREGEGEREREREFQILAHAWNKLTSFCFGEPPIPQHTSSGNNWRLFRSSHASNRGSQVWHMDLQQKLPPTTAHRARQHEAVAHQPVTPDDWKPRQLSQLHWPLSAALPVHPSQSKVEQSRHLHESSRVAKHALASSQWV